MLSHNVTCWGSPAASGHAHSSALPVRAGRLVLFLAFGAGPTSLFSGSSVLNVQQNILSGVEPATKKGSGGGEEKRWY